VILKDGGIELSQWALKELSWEYYATLALGTSLKEI
jgi:hypothetical protein